MLDGLICRVFHKKEVCIEDVVNTIKGVTILVLPPVVSANFIYKYAFTDSYEGDLSAGVGLGMIVGMCATLLTVIYCGIILIDLYDNHKKDVIAVCPNARNEETKE